MKKIFATALAVLLVFAFAAPVSAAGNETTVSTTVTETYTIVIPSTLDITFEEEASTFNIGISDAHIIPGKSVKFSLANNTGTLKNEADEAKTIPYAIKEGETAFDGVSFTENGTAVITIAITQADWTAAAAGTYTDTITFIVECTAD